jgi:hypothetical protein
MQRTFFDGISCLLTTLRVYTAAASGKISCDSSALILPTGLFRVTFDVLMKTLGAERAQIGPVDKFGQSKLAK